MPTGFLDGFAQRRQFLFRSRPPITLLSGDLQRLRQAHTPLALRPVTEPRIGHRAPHAFSGDLRVVPEQSLGVGELPFGGGEIRPGAVQDGICLVGELPGGFQGQREIGRRRSGANRCRRRDRVGRVSRVLRVGGQRGKQPQQ